MKRLALILLLLFGLVFTASARQKVTFWKATTEEEREKLLDYCQIELSILLYMGCEVVSVGLTDNGYLIVYEDFE